MVDWFNLPKEKARQNILAGLSKSFENTEAYVRMVSVASRAFKVPYAAVSVMKDRAHQLTPVGFDLKEVPREEGLCSVSYLDETSPILVLLDTSLHDLGVVSCVPVRFYVAASIFIEGVKVGCIFIADIVPRNSFSHAEQLVLIEMANCISDLLLSHHRQYWQSQLLSVALPSQMLQGVQRPMEGVNQDLKDLENAIKDVTVTELCTVSTEKQLILWNCACRLRASVWQLSGAIDDAIRRVLYQINQSSTQCLLPCRSQKRQLSPSPVTLPVST